MRLNKLVEQFLAERPKDEEVAKYFALASKIGFNQAIDITQALVENCSVPDSFSQPIIEELAVTISLLRQDV